MPTLRKAFQDGVDIHAMTASEMFGVPVKDMPATCAGAPRRSISASSTASRPSALPPSSASSAKEAGAYIKKYFERFPGIRDYMDETREFCREHGYVLTLFGRKCHYPDIKASNPSIRSFNERAAINARLQGSAADIIRRAMIRIEPELKKAKLKAQMLLQVHDELIFEVPDNEVERTLPVVKSVMRRRAASGGLAARAAAGRRPRRRQLGRGALGHQSEEQECREYHEMDDALKYRGSPGAQRDHADKKRQRQKHLLLGIQPKLKGLLKHN